MTESCRLITTEQYQEYLKLKEEHKPLSWKELKEEAKKMGAWIEEDFVFNEGIIHYKKMKFYKNGGIVRKHEYYDQYTDEMVGDDVDIADERTPEQMLMIMRGLE